MTDPKEFKLDPTKRGGLPLNLNGEEVGTADVEIHADGSYSISRMSITNPDAVASLFNIDYKEFSLKED